MRQFCVHRIINDALEKSNTLANPSVVRVIIYVLPFVQCLCLGVIAQIGDTTQFCSCVCPQNHDSMPDDREQDSEFLVLEFVGVERDLANDGSCTSPTASRW